MTDLLDEGAAIYRAAEPPQRCRSRRDIDGIPRPGTAQPSMGPPFFATLRRAKIYSEPPEDHAARRVAGAEGTEMSQIAGRKIRAIFVEGDDGASRAGVAVFLQHVRRFFRRRFAAQHLACDQAVHVDVGLMQP